MTLFAGPQRLTATDASESHSERRHLHFGQCVFRQPFGTTNLNSIVFANGSEFISKAEAIPFGAAQPNSVVVFQAAVYTAISEVVLLPFRDEPTPISS